VHDINDNHMKCTSVRNQIRNPKEYEAQHKANKVDDIKAEANKVHEIKGKANKVHEIKGTGAIKHRIKFAAIRGRVKVQHLSAKRSLNSSLAQSSAPLSPAENM
jgi:hypothetical protein